MRLLYLSADPGVPVFGGKGASVHLRALVAALDGLGHEVMVASPRLEPGVNPLPDGVLSALIPAVRPRECATGETVADRCAEQAAAVIALARAHRAEAIYERYSLMGVAGARAAHALGLPLALEINAPLRDEERRFRQLAYDALALRSERETFAAARRIFTVSQALADWLVGEGVEPARVQVMGNASPEYCFPPRRAIGAQAELVVGFAGGLKPWHGIGTLLEGFGMALEQGGRMRLEILGQGPADELIDRSPLPAGSLRRLGALAHADALDTLVGWDVGVAPFSAVPNFYFSPLKLFEYMAAGLCPVVSEVGELPDIVGQGRAGVVVAPDDPRALADALLALDRDRSRLRELAARAGELIAARPTWTDSARAVLAVLEPALPTPARVGTRG
ncbi:MAG: glycosyltransferase family 4 protein [Candidatus Dormibacteria bacterium]